MRVLEANNWNWASCSCFAVAAMLATLASPAMADEAAAEDQQNVEATGNDIIVTAQFREQTLQSTPIAITAIDADAIAARSAQNVLALAGQAPSVTMKPNGNIAQVYIRGVGQYDSSFAYEPGVGMYIDDVYYSTILGSIFDLTDVQRVEILRGPQGTLAGKNSLGGAIRLYSKKPTGSGDGYAEATIGSFDRLDFRAGVDFALAKDLYARVSGVFRRADGYVTRYDYACTHPGSGLPTYATRQDCVVGKEGGRDYKGAKLALRWDASDRVEINLAGDIQDSRTSPPAATLLVARGTATLNGVPYDSRFVSYGPYAGDTFSDSQFINYGTYTNPAKGYSVNPVTALKGWGVSGVVDVQLTDDMTLKSVTAFRQYDGENTGDADLTPLPTQLLAVTTDHSQFSQELRLTGRLFDGALDYTLGGFYFDSRQFYGGRVDIPATGLDFLQNDRTDSESKAAFAHLEYHLTEKLSVIGGLRYTSESKSYDFRRVPTNGVPNPFIVNGLGEYKGGRWDYRANLSYEVTDDFLAYVQYATGFKGGGVNPRPFYPSQVVPFGPESLEAYEAGFKSSWLGNTVRLNVAAFYNKYDGILVTISNGFVGTDGVLRFPSAVPVNAGNATVKGFEIETDLRPVDNLSIQASLSHLDFKYTDLSAAAQASGITFDMVSPYAPKWKAGGGIQYEIETPIGSFTPRLDVEYQSKLFSNPLQRIVAGFAKPFSQVDAYTLINARLTWALPDHAWSLALSVTNLTDKAYFYNKGDLFSAQGTVQGQPGRPREWALTLKRDF